MKSDRVRLRRHAGCVGVTFALLTSSSWAQEPFGQPTFGGWRGMPGVALKEVPPLPANACPAPAGGVVRVSAPPSYCPSGYGPQGILPPQGCPPWSAAGSGLPVTSAPFGVGSYGSGDSVMSSLPPAASTASPDGVGGTLDNNASGSVPGPVTAGDPAGTGGLATATEPGNGPTGPTVAPYARGRRGLVCRGGSGLRQSGQRHRLRGQRHRRSDSGRRRWCRGAGQLVSEPVRRPVRRRPGPHPGAASGHSRSPSSASAASSSMPTRPGNRRCSRPDRRRPPRRPDRCSASATPRAT